MKKSFVTGLIILLPLAFTLIIARFVINLLSRPFLGIVESVLRYMGILNKGFLFLSGQQVLRFTSVTLSVFVFFLLLFLIGWATRWFVFHTFIRYTDMLFHKIPFVNKIYKACQDVSQTIFSTSEQSFGQVVLAPYPYKDMYAIGLVTQEAHLDLEDKKHRKISVFIPATPNPTMGFVLQYFPEQIIEIDMTVEDALQCLISCGSLMPEFQPPKP